MPKKPELSLREKTFAREYANNGGNATQAALKAGYARSSAHSEGHRLTKRQTVREEVSRLKALRDRAVEDVINRSTRRGALMAYESPAGRLNPSEINGAAVAVLSRAWADALLYDHVLVCLGLKKAIVTKVVMAAPDQALDAQGQPAPASGDPRPVIMEIEQFDRDANAANKALELVYRRVAEEERRPGDASRPADFKPWKEALRFFGRNPDGTFIEGQGEIVTGIDVGPPVRPTDEPSD